MQSNEVSFTIHYILLSNESYFALKNISQSKHLQQSIKTINNFTTVNKDHKQL